jgi:putative membrane protein
MNFKHKLLAAILICSSSSLFIVSCNIDHNQGEGGTKEAAKVNVDVNKLDPQDAKFVSLAASGGMMEVQLANMALQNCQTSTAKDFANAMIADHSRLNKELKDMATAKQLTLPDSLSSDDKSTIDKFTKMDIRQWDKEYITAMVKDHEGDVDLFMKEAEKGIDPDIKAWAGSTLPTLKEHLDMAKADKKILPE